MAKNRVSATCLAKQETRGGKLRHFLLIILCVTNFQLVSRAADAPPRTLSVVIPGMINADGSGSYIQLLELANGITSNEMEILPVKRAVKVFASASVSTCIIPLGPKSAENFGIDTRGKIFSEPFNSSFASIISQRGEASPQSVSDLEGGTVGVVHGFIIAEEVVAPTARVLRPKSMESLLKMLDLGRIDFAYVHFPDVLMSYSHKDMPQFPESSLRFHIVAEAMACTDDMSDWIHRFNKAVDLMYESGEIKNILGPAYTGR